MASNPASPMAVENGRFGQWFDEARERFWRHESEYLQVVDSRLPPAGQGLHSTPASGKENVMSPTPYGFLGTPLPPRRDRLGLSAARSSAAREPGSTARSSVVGGGGGPASGRRLPLRDVTELYHTPERRGARGGRKSGGGGGRPSLGSASTAASSPTQPGSGFARRLREI